METKDNLPVAIDGITRKLDPTDGNPLKDG